MSLSRRRFLGLLGVAPAMPLITKLPAPQGLATGGVVGGAPLWVGDSLTAAGGWCAPMSPTYDFRDVSMVNWPIMGSLPPIEVQRGGVRYVSRAK